MLNEHDYARADQLMKKLDVLKADPNKSAEVQAIEDELDVLSTRLIFGDFSRNKR